MDLALLLRIFFREARGQPNVEIAVLEVFMEKSSEKKRTQKRINLEKIMQERLDTFQDWLYIGKPELMRQYFSDLLPSDYFNKLSKMERQKHTWAQNPSLKMKDSKENVGENEPSQVANKNVEDNYYFQTGLDEKFENSEVAKKYGEKLRELRKKRNYSLEDVSKNTGLSIQNIQLIETGKRKRIDRNRLLLFCGFYQVPPEDMLGFPELKWERQCGSNQKNNSKWPEEGIRPITYDLKETSTKVNFILDSLLWKDEQLLCVFSDLASDEKAIREKVILFLSNMPILKIFTPAKALEYITEYKDQAKRVPDSAKEHLQNKSWEQRGNFILNVSSVLSELEVQTPSLLDVFVSIIACSVETRNIVVQILKWAGFLPDGASTEKINVQKDS